MDIKEASLAADRILNEPYFLAAVAELRADAVEKLVNADPTHTDEIRDTQSLVRALDAITGKLRSTIEAAKVSKR
jgi:hypothetical protein